MTHAIRPLEKHKPQVEGGELVADAAIELALELDPVQAESVEERRKALHDQQHDKGRHGPGAKGKEEQNNAKAALGLEALLQHHAPQHLRQLA